jgi:hypothetical protein
MYTYIVERTQIYLSEAQAAALDREAKRSGVTRSHLIREALDNRYGLAVERERLRSALRATAGLWKDRSESGEAYVERIRKENRMAKLFPEDRADGPGG